MSFIKQLIKYGMAKVLKKDSFYFRILLFHDIKNNEIEKFAKLMEYINDRYNIIDYKNPVFENKYNLLITFDDGFESNFLIKEILDKYQIKAVFFVNRDFIKNDQKQFKNLYRNYNGQNTSFAFMNESNIKHLYSEGHTIGSHTVSHKNLVKISIDEINYEIDENKIYLNKLVDFNDIPFAYPFGKADDIDERAMEISFNYHSFVYSGLRGDNRDKNAKIFFRESIDLKDSIDYIDNILHGGLDFFYLFKQNKINKLAV